MIGGNLNADMFAQQSICYYEGILDTVQMDLGTHIRVRGQERTERFTVILPNEDGGNRHEIRPTHGDQRVAAFAIENNRKFGTALCPIIDFPSKKPSPTLAYPPLTSQT